MADNKTQATDASVDDYIAAIADDGRRQDCAALTALLAKTTRQPARMWGPAIVGYGSYHYTNDSGREGDMCQVGFSSRKSDITLYLMGDFPEREALLAQLGKHKTGKACLYIRRLADVDQKVLAQLVKASVAAVKQRYG